jgi:hypothetical protein
LGGWCGGFRRDGAVPTGPAFRRRLGGVRGGVARGAHSRGETRALPLCPSVRTGDDAPPPGRYPRSRGPWAPQAGPPPVSAAGARPHAAQASSRTPDGEAVAAVPRSSRRGGRPPAARVAQAAPLREPRGPGCSSPHFHTFIGALLHCNVRYIRVSHSRRASFTGPTRSRFRFRPLPSLPSFHPSKW